MTDRGVKQLDRQTNLASLVQMGPLCPLLGQYSSCAKEHCETFSFHRQQKIFFF